jgi:hypothetical protein
MADQKISAMTPAGAITGAELVSVVQSGDNVQTTIADVVAYGNALITLSSLGASANGITLIGHTFAQMRADLDLEAGIDFYSISAADAAIAAAVTTHVGLSDPHTQYLLESAVSANGLTLIGHTFAQMRTDLSLVVGTDVQAYSAKLAALAAQTWAADTISYQTSTSALSTTPLTSFGRSLIDDADAAAAQSTLGLVIGTNVQAYDSDLTTWAGITPASGIGTFLATPSSANLAAAITDENGSGKLIFSAGTLDIASGKTLTISNSLTVTATDGSTVAFGAGGTVVYTSRTISASGLATGGGDLSANRTITVTAANAAETRAQTSTTVALTPANLADKACFSANKNSSDQTGIANNTYTKITFGTEAFDVGSVYDTTNSRWTPPAGKVRVGGQIYLSAGVSASGQYLFMLYKNGSFYRYLQILYAVTTGGTSLSGTYVDSANGTDYYELYLYGPTGSTLTVSGGADASYFQGCQV